MTNLQSNLSQLQAAVVKAAETIYQTHTIDADALDKINQLGLSLIDPLNAEPTDLNDPTPLTVRIYTGIQMVHVKTNESPFVKLMELLDLNGLISEYLQQQNVPVVEEKAMTLEEAKQIMINRYSVAPDLDDDDYEMLAEEYDIELEI